MTPPSTADVSGSRPPDERPPAPSVQFRQLILPVYLPVIATTMSAAMLVPVLPLYLQDAGLQLGTISVVLAAVGLGAALGSLPAGSALARFGERRVMFTSVALAAVATAFVGWTTAVVALMAFRMAAGAANAALRLSRQTFVTRRVPVNRRGRAMSFIGGSFRVSLLIGPLLGGVLTDAFGYTTTFLVAGVLAALGVVPPLIAGPDPLPIVGEIERQHGIVESLRRHWRLVMVVGMVPLLVGTVREGRFAVLPLIGDELGLSPTAVGVVISAGTAADLLLFPVAGFAMDRFGRLFAMVPAFTLIGVGLLVLAWADSTGGVVGAGVIIGVGNGLSSGTMLTFGSDLAPADATGSFLAAMAAMQDAGRVLGPLTVGIVGSAAGLGAAALALGVLMIGTVVFVVMVVGETARPTPLVRDTVGS